MATPTRDELLEQLKQGVLEFDEDAVVEAAQKVVELGYDAYDAVMNGLAEGMNLVGECFSSGKYFVPEVLMATDALYRGLDILRPHITLDESKQVKGSVVIGTVEGDVHDIGKNLVKMMFEIAGFTIHDLGKDVPLDRFVEEQLRTDSEIVCLSAMMTTTMVGMPIVIQKIKAKNPNVKIMVGGAPVSADMAQKWGADGYAEDAPNALEEALRMVRSLKELRGELTGEKSRRAGGLASLLVVGSLLLSSCAAPSARAPAPSPLTVRVGYLVADLHHIAYIVGRDPQAGGGTSFYEQNGIVAQDAVGAPYANGGVVMDHFAAGDVDLGFLGAPPAITKHLNAGVDTKIIAQVNTLGSALIVAPNIQNPKDLYGKTVGVPSHAAIQFFLLLNFAQQKGLDIGKITVVDMPPPTMRVRLEKGEIAGFLAWEPWAADAVEAGAGRVMAASNDIWPNHLDCVLVVHRPFAQRSPEAVRRFLKAHIAATDWVRKALANPGSAEHQHLLKLSASFTQRDLPVVEAAFRNINFVSTLDTAFEDSIRDYASKLIEFRLIAQKNLAERGYADVNDFVGKYVDPAFIRGLRSQ